MPDLSLTELLDIVSAAGTTKASTVLRIKHKPEYRPCRDYYLEARRHIVGVHRSSRPRADLAAILSRVPAKRTVNYEAVLNAYGEWWHRYTLDWFDPIHQVWECDGVRVRVNPELGLTINGEPHLIKLYFKEIPLTRQRVSVITGLMAKVLGDVAGRNVSMSVLDIRRRRLHNAAAVPDPRLDAMLQAEIAYINTLWRVRAA